MRVMGRFSQGSFPQSHGMGVAAEAPSLPTQNSRLPTMLPEMRNYETLRAGGLGMCCYWLRDTGDTGLFKGSFSELVLQ